MHILCIGTKGFRNSKRVDYKRSLTFDIKIKAVPKPFVLRFNRKSDVKIKLCFNHCTLIWNKFFLDMMILIVICKDLFPNQALGSVKS